MITRYNQFNPKRRFLVIDNPDTLKRLETLSEEVHYGGNPEHKKNPGDFGLIPPATPRMGKSLCDIAMIFRKKEALGLLREGMRRGLVSDRNVEGWPRNVWAVIKRDRLIPLEAQLENYGRGCYHGYPMPESDPFAIEVIERWEAHV